MNEMHGQFAWSESGLKLLQTVQEIVDKNGGIEKYRLTIESEVGQDNSYKKNMTNIKKKILMMHNKIYSKDIPKILEISEGEYRKLIHEMKIVGQAKSGGYKKRAKFFEGFDNLI